MARDFPLIFYVFTKYLPRQFIIHFSIARIFSRNIFAHQFALTHLCFIAAEQIRLAASASLASKSLSYKRFKAEVRQILKAVQPVNCR